MPRRGAERGPQRGAVAWAVAQVVVWVVVLVVVRVVVRVVARLHRARAEVESRSRLGGVGARGRRADDERGTTVAAERVCQAVQEDTYQRDDTYQREDIFLLIF